MRRLLERLGRWRQMRRWRAKRAHMFASADLLVVSHTKSGRTWLRVMLSHVWHRTHGVPADELWAGANFHRIDPAIPILFLTHERNEPRAIRARLPELVQHKRLLLLIRDPRDVVVSWYHHHARRSTARARAACPILRAAAGSSSRRAMAAARPTGPAPTMATSNS